MSIKTFENELGDYVIWLKKALSDKGIPMSALDKSFDGEIKVYINHGRFVVECPNDRL